MSVYSYKVHVFTATRYMYIHVFTEGGGWYIVPTHYTCTCFVEFVVCS